MKLDDVSIEKRDGVAIVRFDRKANLNAFRENSVVELTHATRGFHDDLEVKHTGSGVYRLLYHADTGASPGQVGTRCVPNIAGWVGARAADGKP